MLNQRQRDILGLALVACGIFMGFVLYGTAGAAPSGGRLGHGLAVALGWTLGRARVLAPVALVLGGGALLLRPVLPAMRPLRGGAICLFAAATLALAAGMFGLSSHAAGGAEAWTSAHMQGHGGIAGEALYQLAHRLVQGVGVDILVVFLLLTGLILVTGASLAGVLRATGSGLIDSTRIVRGLSGGRPGEHGGRRGASREQRFAHDEQPGPSIDPPDPAPEELIVRSTHVEAPSRDWREEDEPPERRMRSTAPPTRTSPPPNRASSRSCRRGTRMSSDRSKIGQRTPTRPISRRRVGCAAR